jgi:hypothetical protein
MYRLSSNSTLFWKLFFPIFYSTLFGLLTIVAFRADPGDLPFLANPITRIVILTTYIIFVILLFLTIGKLKRVEADDQYIYVSNYIKTYRYLKQDITEVKTFDFLLFKITSLVMREKTKMGGKIRFLGDWTMQKG